MVRNKRPGKRMGVAGVSKRLLQKGCLSGVEDEKRAKSKARWAPHGQVAKMERKNKSKEKKKRRKAEKLRDLVLTAAPNQVLPSKEDVTCT